MVDIISLYVWIWCKYYVNSMVKFQIYYIISINSLHKNMRFSSFSVSVMMYGSETWALKVEDTQKLKRTEASMMRRMCCVSLKRHLSNKALRGRLGIDCVSDLVRRSRLRWFGHVERKDDQQWVKKCMDFNLRWMVVLVGVGLERSRLECE